MKHGINKGSIILIILGAIVVGLIAINPFSIGIDSNELIFVADKTMGVNNVQVTGGFFEFAPGCERMQVLLPVLDENCAKTALAVSGRDRVDVGTECTSFPVQGVGTFRPGQTIQREGYSVSLAEASINWVYGDFSTVIQDAEGHYEDVMQRQTYLNTFSASWKVKLDPNPIVLTSNAEVLNFNKKLPSCVPSGISETDSPRILGATVIDNHDGTFTSIGHVNQYSITLPLTNSGSITPTIGSELGAHTLVFKPYINVKGKLIDVLPQNSMHYNRDSSTSTKVLSLEETIKLPEPSFWQKIQAFIKKLFGG